MCSTCNLWCTSVADEGGKAEGAESLNTKRHVHEQNINLVSLRQIPLNDLQPQCWVHLICKNLDQGSMEESDLMDSDMHSNSMGNQISHRGG